MKSFQKFLSILFATLIFASQSGMAFNLHYCKGALASITLGDAKEVCAMDFNLEKEHKSCCSKSVETSHKKCCKDSSIDLKKIASDDVIIKSLQVDFSPFILPNLNLFDQSYTVLTLDKKSQTYIYINGANAPPLYKLYCKLIFYA